MDAIQHLAAAIHSSAFLVMALFFATLNRHLLLVKPPIGSGPVMS